MSGLQAKPFKARLGLDANNEKVINVKDPTELLDSVNLQYYVATKTVQTFDATRSYPANFIVERADRLYKSKTALTAGAFNIDNWTEIHAFSLWKRIVGAYTAEPGDCLMVNTSTGSITVTMPTPEEGDVVTIMDEGFATTNPIILNAGAVTFDGLATTYSINSSDVTQLVYLGGTWRVNRIVKSTFQYLSINATVAPNSWNLVQTTAARTITLPPAPINGQWVVVGDGSANARNFNITVTGNGKNIQGAASYLIKRFSELVYFIYDTTAGEWKYHSNAYQDRIIESTAPLACERVLVTLDGTAKTMTLPSTGLVSGDWVEVSTKFQDEVATGSLVVSAGGANYFRLNGGSQNTTTYRIKERGTYLFVYKAGEWTVIAQNKPHAMPNLTTGNMVSNTLVTLVGTAAQTIYLPSADQVQVGDFVTARLNTSGASVVISVQSVGNDLLDAGTSVTYTIDDNNMLLTFVYRGWNGTKYVWETINHGNAYLKKTQNGADIPNKGTFRTNIDVFSKGESDARFLGINANAVTATQAANADKLDNLDSSDFIQVKNPSIAAVDANTTSETRFTTNVNTPDATSWQVVTFLDQTTGDKAQIAMSRTTSKIAYRSYASSAWSAWSFLDQSGNAASASKWNTARTITLTGDATGSVSIDGSANVSFATTVESAAVNLEDLTAAYASIKNGVFVDYQGTVTTFIGKDGAGSGLILKVDSATGSGHIGLWDGSNWVTSRLYNDLYHPTADKWSTARTITFTGGLSGSATIDGSANVSIDTTVNAGAHTHTIAQVTGLQAALDGKLGSSAKAADSELLDGVNGADYCKAIAATNSGEDPDITTTELILTNHENTPDGGLTYWFVDTKFYQTRAVGSNRFQFASQFNGGTTVQFRNYVSGAWSDWAAVAAIIDGSTYNINISGTAANADQATKLQTARTINGVSFDGTANITVADATKLPLAGGFMTGDINYQNISAGGWARGLKGYVQSTGVVGGSIGILGSTDTISNVYMGMGATPWAAGTGIRITSGGVNVEGITTFTSSIALPNATTLDGVTNGLQITNSTNGTVVIGNRNTSYTHYQSSGSSGHYFYGNVAIQTQLTAPAIVSSGASDLGTLSVGSGAFTSNGSTHNFDSWVRTAGASGWFSQDYSGGIHMTDTTWVRVYNAKSLYVGNSIAATGNITAYYSDERLKENLKPISNALETVKSWTGYKYNANVLAQSFGYDPNKKEIGLLAQQVQKTTPEAVEQAPFDLTAIPGKSLTGQNYLTLKYERLVPILVEAIKEQDKEIQELKQQVAFLMEEFKKLQQ